MVLLGFFRYGLDILVFWGITNGFGLFLEVTGNVASCKLNTLGWRQTVVHYSTL